MNAKPYSRVLNFAWYQLIWFGAVVGGVMFEPLLGLMIVLHLVLVRRWKSEFLLMTGAAIVGGGFDAVLTSAGFFAFDQTPSLLPIPLWLFAIWMGFAGTLNHSMSFMVARPRLMAIAAAFFAPMTYLVAQRLGAVTFPYGNAATAIAIGLSWWMITPALVWMSALSKGEVLQEVSPTRMQLRSQEV